MNAFYAENKHFWRWRRMYFAVEMNTLTLETNVLKRVFELQPHTHTAIYQRLPSRIYVEMIAIVQLLMSEIGAIMMRRSKRYLGTQQRLWLQWIGLQDQVNREIHSQLLLTHHCTRLVVWVWPDCTCHTQNNWTEAPEVDDWVHEACLETVSWP